MSAIELPADTQTDQEQRIQALESRVRELEAKLETAEEALTGAQNIVRELRDKDSGLPALADSHHGLVAAWPGYKGELQY